MSTLLEISELCWQVDGKSLLDDISISVTPGTMVAVVGPNGAGKSTLLKILAGVYAMQAGTVTLDNRDLQEWTDSALARHRSWLPQYTPLSWPLTVEQVVTLGRLPWGTENRIGLEPASPVNRALADCDLQHLRSRQVSSLSQGEQALTNMARVLATEAPLLLLDEPVAALDPRHQLQLLDLIRSRCDNSQTGCLVILHDLGLAARYCDKVLLLSNGRMAASGEPATVLTPANISACYSVDMTQLQGQFGPIPEFNRKPVSHG